VSRHASPREPSPEPSGICRTATAAGQEPQRLSVGAGSPAGSRRLPWIWSDEGGWPSVLEPDTTAYARCPAHGFRNHQRICVRTVVTSTAAEGVNLPRATDHALANTTRVTTTRPQKAGRSSSPCSVWHTIGALPSRLLEGATPSRATVSADSFAGSDEPWRRRDSTRCRITGRQNRRT
jgi:hypothetical protein